MQDTRKSLAFWFLSIGAVMLVREGCAAAGVRFVWAEGWLHVGSAAAVEPALRLLAGLAVPFAFAFLYVGARLNRLLEDGSELPMFISWLALGRAGLQVGLEHSLGYSLSWAPLVGMTILALLLRRSIDRVTDAPSGAVPTP
jgi:hypothetical protein